MADHMSLSKQCIWKCQMMPLVDACNRLQIVRGLLSQFPQTEGTQLEATIPTRGLIGFEFELLNLTSGEGIMSHLFKEYRPDSGDIRTRRTGTLVSMEKASP